MERIKSLFGKLEEKGEKPLIIYATGCDPDFETSLNYFRLIFKYADIVEIGIPFSDPLADGPTIQKAHERALKSGATLKKIIEIASILRNEFPEKGIVLMGYYNPIFVYGEDKFIKDSKEAGVDGFIVPDLPPEEGMEFSKKAKKEGLEPVFLAAPTSTDERLKLIGEASGNFIYYVSLTGTTGMREELQYERICRDIERVKSVTGKKVVVGFGISRKEHIFKLYKSSDGFVVGSAVVNRIENEDLKGLESLLFELKNAIKEAAEK
ncbi:tryptophan synthase subunit alpha [Desulfurobacterium atlanticum]|uniref:Tryptophan synthase alpha chain n=1 Tax=Desulfurobacterium atlanticum TaxID=240169 RepID=A0A238YNM4_9BACT|nr:tryptophan synthase subunit alpha [Desulfurobacterium atlanticum]SNR72612.1 tryptophan synthase, alpha chain [Desulfurobacterium atlanticum]